MKFINLKLFRKEHGLTQQHLAEVLQLPQSTISYLENGLQEATDHLLNRIKGALKIDDIDGYIYERKTFNDSERLFLAKKKEKTAIFDMDWNELQPVEEIEGFQIVCKTGQISIAKDGTLLIDRDIGIGYRLNRYIIRPDKFDNPNLLLAISSRDWFDYDIFEDFKTAYYIGCRIAGVLPTEQLKVKVQT